MKKAIVKIIILLIVVVLGSCKGTNTIQIEGTLYKCQSENEIIYMCFYKECMYILVHYSKKEKTRLDAAPSGSRITISCPPEVDAVPFPELYVYSVRISDTFNAIIEQEALEYLENHNWKHPIIDLP